ncbi:MAG: tetratricopeptide repeat protein [Candidatus Polarisedimenticolia bacterium]
MAVALLAALLHIGTLGHGFTFDDPFIVVENPAVAGDGGLLKVFATPYWTGWDEGNLYRPLTVASYWVQRRLAGVHPWSYHLVNVLLHALVTWLVCRLGERLIGWPAALAAGLLFAAHPVHVEAVANVAGRAELMAAAGALAAWLWRERPVVSMALLAAGLLSKEIAVVLPGLLAVEDLARGGRIRWRALVPAGAVTVAFLIIRAVVVGLGVATSYDPFIGLPAAQRVMTAVDVLGRELALMLVPRTLSADYSYDQIPLVGSPLHPGFLMGLAALALCGVAAMLCRRRAGGVTLGMATFFVAVLPVSNLFFGIGVMMAERLLYLPSVGACLAGGAALAAAGSALSPRQAVAATLAVALAAAVPLSARSAWRVNDWFDQLTLFEATVRSSPRSALGHVNLGTVYHQLGRLPEAEEQFRAAEAIAPHQAGTHFNLGSVLEARGRLDEAMAAYAESARLAPPGDPRPAAALRRLQARAAAGAGARGGAP